MKALLVTAALLLSSISFGSQVDGVSQTRVKNFFTKLINQSNSLGEAASTVGTPLYSEDLKSHALHRYLNLYKNFGSDYAPQAFLVADSVSGLGTDLIVITNDNDGGAYMYIYTIAGEPIASASQGESGDLL